MMGFETASIIQLYKREWFCQGKFDARAGAFGFTLDRSQNDWTFCFIFDILVKITGIYPFYAGN
jgi:hypothetical protein